MPLRSHVTDAQLTDSSDPENEDGRSGKRKRRPSQPSRPPISKFDLTDSSSNSDECGLQEGQGSGRQRRKPKPRLGPPLNVKMKGESFCKDLAMKWRRGCKRRCLEGFLRKNSLQALMVFREAWCSLHKLDQDRLASSRNAQVSFIKTIHVKVVSGRFFQGSKFCTAKVYDKLKEIMDAAAGGKVSWEFEGHHVCFRAWKLLHGLGDLVEVYDDLCSCLNCAFNDVCYHLKQMDGREHSLCKTEASSG